jgi:hypothetical protein
LGICRHFGKRGEREVTFVYIWLIFMNSFGYFLCGIFRHVLVKDSLGNLHLVNEKLVLANAEPAYTSWKVKIKYY